MTTLPKTRDELRERWQSGEQFQFYLFYGHKPPAEGVDASCLSQWFVRDFTIDDINYPTAEHWMMAEKARLFGDDAMLLEILASAGPRDAKAYGRKVSGFDNEIWGQRKFDIVVRGNLAKFSQHEDLKQFLLSTALFKTPADSSADDQPVTANPTAKFQLAAETGAGYDVDGHDVDGHDADVDAESSDASVVRERTLGYEVNQPRVANSNVILVEAAGRDTIWGIGLGVKNPKSQDPCTWRGLNLLGFALTIVRDQLMIAD